MGLRAIELLAARHARERDATLLQARARKRALGIVHTPSELARAVVRESDRLLREGLAAPLGICDPSVLLIDPACGPGAFFAAALALAEERAGGCVHGVGFDVDESALSLACRLREHPAGRALCFEHADVLAGNAVLAHARKHAGPLLVLGNPPWATARAQPTAVDQARLEAFRHDAAGERLRERKLGVLSDAYVRFFALCLELARSRRAGAIVALVSNASYLDGPVHRGMRAQLLAHFDELRVLDLGGSGLLARSRERRDENIFGVRPGVASIWLCRYPGEHTRPAAARSGYARLFGSRHDKLQQLLATEETPLAFASLEPQLPHLCFVPRPRVAAGYLRQPALSEWQPFSREGVQSNRDAVVIDTDPERLLERLRAFSRGATLPELAIAQRALPHYDPATARRKVAASLERDPRGQLGFVVQRMLYRPFDERVFCPVAPLCHRPRAELARALDHAPLALLSVRKDRGELPWTHSAFAYRTVDNCYFSTRSSCRTRAFPAFTPEGEPNLAQRFAEPLAAVLGEAPSVGAFQHYALCVMGAGSYRARWDAELHQDYPRIPMPESAGQFRELAGWGARLAALFAEPCRAVGQVAEPAARARVRDLTLSAVDGGMRLERTLLITLDADALGLCVGHHRPLAAYLAAHADEPLDRRALSTAVALAERLNVLAHTLRAADRAVAAAFAYDATSGD